jgi:hypothetical protein
VAVAAVGAVEEANDEVRFTHDGTHGVLLNHEIRPRDYAKNPVGTDARRLMEVVSKERLGRVVLSIVFDVSKAHRRILIDERDWGLMGCTCEETPPQAPEDPFDFNRVGTYGMGSASYWWSRMGTLIVRAMHYILGERWAAYMLLYVDDGKATAFGPHLYTSLVLAVATFVIFRFPLKWEKTGGGLSFDYVGYHMDWETFRIGINIKRAAWLTSWCRDVVRRGVICRQELAEVMGRWVFVGRVLDEVRPFLGPLFAWLASMSPNAKRRLPAMIRLLLGFLEEILETTPTVTCEMEETDAGELFRADARADGSEVELGGWECGGGQTTKEARWWSLKLTKKQIPWAFERGEDPKRVISSLELLASLICLLLFTPSSSTSMNPRRYLVKISGGTDNQGNGYLIDKYMTTAFPSCCILMQLARACARRGIVLSLNWREREQNQEADDLSNSVFTRFDLRNRVHVSYEDLELSFMNTLLKKGTELYKEVKEAREQKKEAQKGYWRGGPKRLKKLRVRAPWNQDYPDLASIDSSNADH